MIRKRSRPKIHLTWSEKVPERFGKTNAKRRCLRKQLDASSYGNPVLEWRRPGGSVLALKDRGRKHTLACRHIAMALATLKQSN